MPAVKILKTIGPEMKANQIVDVDETRAVLLVNAKLAEPAPDPKKEG